MENINEEASAVDFERIQDTSGGDQEFESELFEIFMEDCEERIALVKSALEAGDLEAWRREAHTIKGAGANIGTTLLHDIAFQMEQCDGASLAAVGPALTARLEEEYGRVVNAINGYLSNN